MSRHTARLVLDQFHDRPSFVAARYAMTPGIVQEVTSGSGLLSDVRELASANVQHEQAQQEEHRRVIASSYGLSDYAPNDDKPFLFSGGMAIIPIHGILINRFAYSWSFITGYNFIRSQVEAALADPDVTGIIYDVNSQGGMVSGCKETADIMFAASKKGGGKPSLAVVDSSCYSAAYMLASAADKVAVTPTGGAGSIGVLLMHMDVSAALEKMGVKVTFIFSGDHKVDGNSFEPLSDEVKADIQAEITKLYNGFVATVVRNRPSLTSEVVVGTQAKCYLADDALAIGLIDSVQTPPEALEGYFNADEAYSDGEEEPDENHNPNDELDDPATEEDDEDEDDDDNNPRQEHTMATSANVTVTAKPPAQTSEQVAAEARKAERARMNAILNHPEAEGRKDLANHLATETDMTVEAAAGVLKASPKAAAPATTTPTAPEATNHFANAMDKSKHPNVGDNDGASANNGKPTRAQQMLGAQSKLTGRIVAPAGK